MGLWNSCVSFAWLLGKLLGLFIQLELQGRLKTFSQNDFHVSVSSALGGGTRKLPFSVFPSG